MMSKIFVVCLVLTCLAAANSQGVGYFGFGGSFGFGIGQNFHTIVLQSAAAKLREQNLPEDLQARVTDVLENAEIAFTSCESFIIWQYKRCTALELRNALLALSAIEDEAKLRNSTSTVAPVASSGSDASPAPDVSSAPDVSPSSDASSASVGN